jgi:hypothetical protein
MSNSEKSNDFNMIRTERGPNVAAESRNSNPYRGYDEVQIPSQAAACGQAQHGVDFGSGQACGGQAVGDTVLGTAGRACWPKPEKSWDLTSDDAKKLAEATLKLQADRNREIAERKLALKSQAKVADAMQREAVFRRRDAQITLGVGAEIARREMVAKQQAALLDEVAADAVAPASERFKPLSTDVSQDTVTLSGLQWERVKVQAERFEALERQVRWLMSQGSTHARQIAALTARVKDLEHVIAEAFPARPVGYRVSNGLDTCLSGGPSVVAPDHVTLVKAAMAETMPKANPGCEHDMLKPSTTVSAITRKKARCNACAQVWEVA